MLWHFCFFVWIVQKCCGVFVFLAQNIVYANFPHANAIIDTVICPLLDTCLLFLHDIETANCIRKSWSFGKSTNFYRSYGGYFTFQNCFSFSKFSLSVTLPPHRQYLTSPHNSKNNRKSFEIHFDTIINVIFNSYNQIIFLSTLPNS